MYVRRPSIYTATSPDSDEAKGRVPPHSPPSYSMSRISIQAFLPLFICGGNVKLSQFHTNTVGDERPESAAVDLLSTCATLLWTLWCHYILPPSCESRADFNAALLLLTPWILSFVVQDIGPIGPDRNWKGIGISLLVILVVLSLIGLSIVLLSKGKFFYKLIWE